MKISFITKVLVLCDNQKKDYENVDSKGRRNYGVNFWEKGPLFVKQLLDFYDEPRPHFNTLSTIVRGLEEKGFLSHEVFGNTYQYYAVVSCDDFKKKTLKGVISKYFNNSYLGAVSSLVKEEEISLDELKQLIRDVEKAHE